MKLILRREKNTQDSCQPNPCATEGHSLAQQLLSIKVKKNITLKKTVLCYYQGVLKRVIHSVELEMNEYKLNHFFFRKIILHIS